MELIGSEFTGSIRIKSPFDIWIDDGSIDFGIGKGSGLGCSFSKPEERFINSSEQDTYEFWLLNQIQDQNPRVIKALDEIAYKLLDGKDINLITMDKLYADVIRKIIMEKLNAI